MGQKVEEIEKLWDGKIKILERDFNSLDERCHCICNVCGHEWTPQFANLKYGRGCSNCSKIKRMEKIEKDKLERKIQGAKEYAEGHNIEIKNVFFKKKTCYVEGVNHNLDKRGNEYGEFIKEYYSFIKGSKTQKEIGDELSYSSEVWINKAKLVHPEYDYSKTDYINNRTSVKIICPIHGEFSVMPKAFMKKTYKCAKCKREDKIKEKGKEVIKTLEKKYPLLDFSKSVYKGRHSKILVGGYKDGYREVEVGNLLCSDNPKSVNPIDYISPKAYSFKEFIEKDKAVHKEYDFTLNEEDFKGMAVPMKMKCNKCGYEFKRTPKEHLNGFGCVRCRGRFNLNTEELVDEFRKIHGDKYDYSKTEYKKMSEKVCIICHNKNEFGEEHGEFWETPKLHLRGYGCKKCSNVYLDTDLFIKRANVIHGNKYDYSKVDYKTSNDKVCIICPEHGEFWQKANSHMNGQGCPLCKTSHIERELDLFFKKINIEYVYQYRDKSIFGSQSLDFYIPDKKIGIECQSEIHYSPNYYKHKGKEDAEKAFEYRQELDTRKRQLCKDNGIHLIYYMDKKFLKYETSGLPCFTDVEKLLEYIENHDISKSEG